MGESQRHRGVGTYDGLVVVDKPAGWTSHDVVARCRRIFGQRRVGHTGTLDPDATGVLLVALGKATRLIRFLSELPKVYQGEVVLGVATSTLDSSGETVGTWPMRHITLEQAQTAAQALTGDILQIPPMVSALKVEGRRLHEMARAGIEVERKARPVTVYRFNVEMSADQHVSDPMAGPVLAIEVECSSGTYVRTLAADIGGSLGGGAHLRALRRTAIGGFEVESAHTLESLEAEPEIAVLSPSVMVASMPNVEIGGELITAVRQGKVMPVDEMAFDGPGPWAVLDESGALLAVYEAHKAGTAKPSVVLSS